MTSYTKEREQFIANVANRIPLYRLRDILAAANAHQRAAEGDCSIPAPDGTYDDDETGKRGYWSRRADRAERRILAALEGTGWTAHFAGDPRGATVTLYAPGEVHDETRHGGLAVPAQGYTTAQMDRMTR